MSDAPAAPVTENGVPPAAQDEVVEETPGFKVFAGNLAYSTTDEGLKAFFAPVQSDILSAQVIMRGTRSAGYGFVSVATAEAAQKAVELLDKTELDGRPVIVEVAKPADQKDKEKKQRKFKRRPGRRGSKSVPGEVSEADTNGEANGDVFEKIEGAAPGNEEGAKPKKKNRSKRKAKARKAAAAAAEGEAPSGTEGATSEAKRTRTRKPRPPRPHRAVGEEPLGEPSKSVLFVANLGFSIDDAGLAQLFTDAEISVTSARIVRRRWGRPRKSKGYGFVDVGDEENQKKAIELLQGKEVEGRAIAVKIAVNPQTEEGDEAEHGAEAEQLELESREEGLRKSLFERAKEEEVFGQQNKALAMMKKMGYKPGESLGQKHDEPGPSGSAPATADKDVDARASSAELQDGSKAGIQHITEPLPLQEWAGRKGIGLGKRAASPSAAERLAKMAKMAEETDHATFRDRAREEYEQRRAHGRLAPAQRTCINLDEKAGIKFNVLWLNPDNPETFPEGLLDALDNPVLVDALERQQADRSIEGRLKARMRVDALRPLATSLEEDDDPGGDTVSAAERESPCVSTSQDQTYDFMVAQTKDRLQLVLDYLRQKYAYCFWCGTQYDDREDMERNCPGPDEEAHD
ncbi:RNA-binding domain-containing protein [Laetiporus sulphureus 93-53]|uniref:RNA-binding domain-containing protein n=1 Tax=Laetiporus sulphureus 93-53 TaxID=1314785 RepID=A0A165IF19_9APHY|nr:RNA-binding domain-containing protein [Laetiporus sulphureus 93-53]KZT12985.1 RNA-binding domain-containing protein [Laetiporus sulphureus 93-53]